MGFHRRTIPDLRRMKEIHQQSESDEDFIKQVVGKAEAIMGPDESIKYLDQVYEKIISANGRKP